MDDETFRREYFIGNRPLVIRGAVTGWPALSLWSRQYFESFLDNRMVTVDYSSDGFLKYTQNDEKLNVRSQDVSLLQALKEIHDPTGQRLCYLRNISLPTLLPELIPDIEKPSLIGDPNKVILNNLWYGAARCTTSLHHDWPNNFLAQVKGRKKVILFNPEQTPYLYPVSNKPPAPNDKIDFRAHSLVNPEQPNYEQFPRFKEATPLTCILEPGDILWLPPEWWHQVTSIDISISVNFWWLPHIDQFIFIDRYTKKLPWLYDSGSLETLLAKFFDHRDLDGTIGVAERCLDFGRPWVACLFGATALDNKLRHLCHLHGIVESNNEGKLKAQDLNLQLARANISDRINVTMMSTWDRLIKEASAMDDSKPKASEVDQMLRQIRKISQTSIT